MKSTLETLLHCRTIGADFKKGASNYEDLFSSRAIAGIPIMGFNFCYLKAGVCGHL